MAPSKKRFTEDFIAKWGKASETKPDKTSSPLLERQRKLLNSNPNNARLWMAHGETLLDMGRSKEAFDCFEKVRALAPDLPGLSLNRARAQMGIGNFDGASRDLIHGLTKVSSDIQHPLVSEIISKKPADSILADMVIEELDDPERQRKMKAIELLTTVPGLGSLKGRVLFDAGFRSVDDLREASVEELSSIEGIGLKSAQKIKIIVTLDEQAEGIGLPVIDELHIKDQVEEFACPLCGTILEVGEHVCYQCGMKFKEESEAAVDDDLLSRLEEVDGRIQDDPDDIELWFLKGEILAKMDRTEESIKSLNEVTRIDPNYPGVWNMKAEVFTKMGEHKKAASCYKRAMELGVTTTITETDAEMEDLLLELEAVEDDTEVDKEIWITDQRKIQKDLLELEDKEIDLSGLETDISDRESSILDSITKKLDTVDKDISKDLLELELDDDEIDIIESTLKPLDTKPETIKSPLPDLTEDEEEAIDELTHLFSEGAKATSHKTEDISEDEERIFESITKPLGSQSPQVKDRGMTNGLVKKGFVNGVGRTNGAGKSDGMTNGLTNGMGRTNGMTNGLTNGIGRTNGMTNGLTNGLGRTNGITNGIGRTNGLTNGMGRTNGMTNGLTNGLRALRSGMTNGLTNGTGLTSGLGGARFSREARQNKWKLFIIPLVAVLLMIVPMLTVPTVIEDLDSIMIDGDLADWTDISETISGVEAVDFNPNVDIIAMAAKNNDDKYLSFLITIVDEGEIFAGEPVNDAGLVDTFHIFLDTDNDLGTGYSIAGIGVDHMIEMRGWNREVIASQILEFTGTDNDNWRGFRATGTTVAKAAGQTVETQIAWSAMGLTEPGPVAVYAHSQSYDGYHDYSDYLISDSLSIIGVTQRSTASEILSGNSQSLLGLDIKATETDAVLNSIQITLGGTSPLSDISAVRLEDSSGTTIAETTQMSRTINLDMGAMTLPAGETRSFTLEVDISPSAEAGRTLGATISSASGIDVENGAASLVTEPSSHDMGYIEVVPFGVMIDGGFSDWPSPLDDELGEPATGSSHSVDISKYGAYNDGSKLSFYMRTNGNFMGGASVPHAGGIKAPSSEPGTVIGPGPIDSDGDGILDENEPGYEYDFNNDGIPDSQSDDDDGDGEIDYDAGGTDEVLFNNQTKATKYIGPVDPEPPSNGYDITRIYVDADNDTSTGYIHSGLGADYLIEFTGKYGIVKSSSIMEFIGSNQGQWNWTENGSPDFRHDTRQLEAMLDIQTTEEISASFETKAWNDDGDDSDIRDVPMTRPQTRSEPPPPTTLGAPQDPLYNVTWGNGSAANDRFGWNVSWAGDVNADGIDDIIVGAPYVDYNTVTDCGAAYIFFGYTGFNVSNSKYMNASRANVTIYGASASDHFGWDVSDAGDVNGDGYGDIIVGAPDALTYSTNRNGSAYIFYGKGLNWEGVTDDGIWALSTTSANVTIVGEADGDKFGASVSGAGNFDNSGNVDVVVGAYLSNAGGTDRGKTYIFYGDGSIPTSVASADVVLKGKIDNGHFGFSVSNGGDVDGTAGSEVIVGEPGNDKAYVYYKQIDQLADADVPVTGVVDNDYSYTQTSDNSYEIITEILNSGSTTIFNEDFEDALGSEWSTYNSDLTYGRNQRDTYSAHGGNYSWRMDVTTSGYYNLNELVLTFDASSYSSVDMSFWTIEYGDEENAMSATFAGHENSDGVAVSDDGTNWVRVWTYPATVSAWTSYGPFDIGSLVSLTGTVYIKFQQYDNYVIATDGILWDDIVVNGTYSHSELEHKWTIPVTASGSFYLEANRTASTDDDNYTFYYTTDPSTGVGITVGENGWTKMLTVTKAADDNSYQTYTDSTLEDFIGTLYIGAIDTDRTPGNTSNDNISIDHMFIRGAPYDTFYGDSNTDFGWSVADAGNMNNGGNADVIVGAPGTTNGNAYVWMDGDFKTTTSRTDTSQVDFTASGSSLASTNPSNSVFATNGGELNLTSSTIYENDFDTGETLNTDPSGWTVTEGLNTDVYIDNAQYTSSPYSCYFADNDTTNNIQIDDTFTDSTGFIHVEFKARPISTGADQFFSLALFDGATFAGQMGFSSGNIITRDFTGGGDSWNTVISYSANTWYTVRLIVDTANDRFDVYVDDVLEYEDCVMANIATVDSLSGITFLTGSTANAGIWLDDIHIYTQDSPGYYTSSTTTAPYYIMAVKPYWNITYENTSTVWINISRDGGATWNQSTLTEGLWYTFPTEPIGNDLQYRIEMITIEGVSPIIKDLTIYYIYCNPPDITFVGESTGDKFGYSVHGAGDINGDGIDDIIIGAPYNSNGSASGGAVYIFNGSSTLSGTIYAWNANYTNYSYDAGSHFGWSVCKAGDTDNDGYNDVIIGAPRFTAGSNADAGKAWIMSIAATVIIISEYSTIALVIFMPMAIFSIVRRKRRGYLAR